MSYFICEQQRRRSACTSAQSDQHLCCSLVSNISLDSIVEISRLYLASVAVQAGLCLAWSETPKDTFCRVVAQMFSVTIKAQGIILYIFIELNKYMKIYGCQRSRSFF